MSGRLWFACLRLLVPVVAIAIGGILAADYFTERFGIEEPAYFQLMACAVVLWVTCFAPSAVFELAASQGGRLPVHSRPFPPTLRPVVFQVRTAYVALGGLLGMAILAAPVIAQAMGQTLRPVDRITCLVMAAVLLLEAVRAFRISVTVKRDRIAVTGRERREVMFREICNVEITRSGPRAPNTGVVTLRDGRRVEINGRLKNFDLAMGMIYGAVFPEETP
ncbi:hypothetical protein [Dyella amyloliquefaciens]|uniref:hypothetical protein n=1 Tax=Dyella amyloliquefaciens TaxID=1770545 RepID=UPI00102EC8B5|nr:hypothetical protein [Dyella amyloliquefaciens]